MNDNHSQNRIDNLVSYIGALLEGRDIRETFHKHEAEFTELSSLEIFRSFKRILNQGYKEEKVIEVVPRVILATQTTKEDAHVRENDPFLKELRAENQAMDDLLREIRPLLLLREQADGTVEDTNTTDTNTKDTNTTNPGTANESTVNTADATTTQAMSLEARDAEVARLLGELRQMDTHFVRLQNIFFPTLELKDDAMTALSIFWAWQDEAEEVLEKAIASWTDPRAAKQERSQLTGKLFGFYASIAYKEEQFLYPTAAELFDEADWEAMYRQSLVYPTAFDVRKEVSTSQPQVTQPQAAQSQTTQAAQSQTSPQTQTAQQAPQADGVFRTETGALSYEQLSMVLNQLPVDFTVVDENNRVLFFSNPPKRIFPRSPAIVGREVRNCHPPKSLAKVEEIIDSFREGRQSHARFWIDAHGRKIMIEYFSLRDTEGVYRGVLEVSQDITEIQQLEGERRLAEWQ